ncbi:MAG TPA: GNAT family N-acetyltransferase [Chloroflexia bacterium]|nr:GNAT family N-acetyltransferase [Chloroflexia bacterium]
MSLKIEESRLVVRKATPEDASKLLNLICALADFEKLPRPDEAAQQRLIDHGFGPQPKFEVSLAEVDGQAVGYTISFETYSSFLALPTFYLEDLFVLPEYRKFGIGQALFKNCVKEALRRGCGRMEWSVLDWNENAINFYERMGAKRLSEWLSYRLTQEDMVRLTAEA